MAVDYNRQYIGARYVPTFFNNPDGSWDWAEGFQYEPLTIVKYGTSTFTSKKLVPSTVGAPNTAPEYWALTGDYNGYLIELDGKVSQLTNKVNNLYLNWKSRGKTLVIFGDNYAIGNTASWISRLENVYGMTVINNSVENNTAVECAQAYINSNITADYVLIMGCVYSYLNQQPLSLVRNTLLSACEKAHRANQKIYFFTSLGNIYGTLSKEIAIPLQLYRMVYQNVIYREGYGSLVNGLQAQNIVLGSDQITPTNNTALYLADCIIDAFENGFYISFQTENHYYTPANMNISVSGSGNITATLSFFNANIEWEYTTYSAAIIQAPILSDFLSYESNGCGYLTWENSAYLVSVNLSPDGIIKLTCNENMTSTPNLNGIITIPIIASYT